MECKIYGFEELDEGFLAVPDHVLPANIINDMEWIPGELVLKGTLNITRRSLLLGLSPIDVLENIEKQGCHLKWPTTRRGSDT